MHTPRVGSNAVWYCNDRPCPCVITYASKAKEVLKGTHLEPARDGQPRCTDDQSLLSFKHRKNTLIDTSRFRRAWQKVDNVVLMDSPIDQRLRGDNAADRNEGHLQSKRSFPFVCRYFALNHPKPNNEMIAELIKQPKAPHTYVKRKLLSLFSSCLEPKHMLRNTNTVFCTRITRAFLGICWFCFLQPQSKGVSWFRCCLHVKVRL